MNPELSTFWPVTAREAVTAADNRTPYWSARMTPFTDPGAEDPVQILTIAALRDYFAGIYAEAVPPDLHRRLYQLADAANERLGLHATRVTIGAAGWLAWVTLEQGWKLVVASLPESHRVVVDPAAWEQRAQRLELEAGARRYETSIQLEAGEILVGVVHDGGNLLFTGDAAVVRWDAEGRLVVELRNGRRLSDAEGG